MSIILLVMLIKTLYKHCFVYLIPLLWMMSVICFAQTEEMDADQLDFQTVNQYEESVDEKTHEEPKKFDTSLEVGTSFSVSPNNYYGNSIYVAPQLSYLATPRLTLSVGVAMEYSQLYPTYPVAEGNTMLPMTRAFMYARGAYLVSPNVTVYGTAYKTINDVPRRVNAYHTGNYDYSGFDVGVNYKISESFSIGVQLRMDNGPGPNYYNNGLFPADSFVPMRGY